MNLSERLRDRRAWCWLALFALALGLRAFHLTGYVLNQDEGHWLLYSLQKNLLFQQWRNSFPRPDALFPVLATAPVALIGANELALRILPALFGAASIFPLALFVRRMTGSDSSGWIAALLLAVSPLHVHFSAQGIPDSIALFFLLCALERFAWATGEDCRNQFIGFACFLALSILTKATALYFWALLFVMGIVFFRGRQRRNYIFAIVGSLLPIVAMFIAIKLRGNPVAMFEEPVAVSDMAFQRQRVLNFLELCGRFYHFALLAAFVGVVVAARRQRRWLVFLLPLLLLIVAPILRVNSKELLWLIPTLFFFAAIALDSLPKAKIMVAGLAGGMFLAHAVLLPTFPQKTVAQSAGDRSTAVLDRPAGWPSRAASNWLLRHVTRDDTVLIAMFTFTDPVYLRLRSHSRVLDVWDHFELLRDPKNRVRYVVFVDDYQRYAASFAQFAEARFGKPPDATFANYAIFDCRRDGRFVAYPDAFNSPDSYVRRGKSAQQRGDAAAAIDALETARRLDPNLLAVVVELVPAYATANRLEDALTLALEIVRRSPNDIQTNTNLALLYFKMNRVEEGIAQCEKNLRLGISPQMSADLLAQFRQKKN